MNKSCGKATCEKTNLSRRCCLRPVSNQVLLALVCPIPVYMNPNYSHVCTHPLCSTTVTACYSLLVSEIGPLRKGLYLPALTRWPHTKQGVSAPHHIMLLSTSQVGHGPAAGVFPKRSPALGCMFGHFSVPEYLLSQSSRIGKSVCGTRCFGDFRQPLYMRKKRLTPHIVASRLLSIPQVLVVNVIGVRDLILGG